MKKRLCYKATRNRKERIHPQQKFFAGDYVSIPLMGDRGTILAVEVLTSDTLRYPAIAYLILMDCSQEQQTFNQNWVKMLP